MVQVLGNATTGNVYNDAGPVDIPRDTTTIRPAHKPWCVDCKRKDRELDTDQLCPQCARAAVTRAAAAARRAEADRVAAELASAEKAENRAKKIQTNVATPKPPMEGKQGKPTTRRSAPRATSTSSTSGRAPDAGSSTHREKNPPAAQEMRPAVAGGPSERVENREADQPRPLRVDRPTAEQILDAQVEHAANLLRSTNEHAHPSVRAARAAVVATLEALHLTTTLAAPIPATPAPVAKALLEPAPPAPHPVRPATRRAPRDDVDEQGVVRQYRDGDSATTIATRLGTTPARIRRILDRNNVERRDDRARSGGRNRIEPTPELLAELRRQYVDEQATIVALAEQHGLHRRIVTRFLTDAGVTIRPPAHLRGTDLTPEQVTELVDAYRAGAPSTEVATRFGIRATTARLLIAQAGVEVRGTKGASVQIAERLQDLGVTAKEVKQWAHAQGLIDRVGPGLVAVALIDQYAAAHRKNEVA